MIFFQHEICPLIKTCSCCSKLSVGNNDVQIEVIQFIEADRDAALLTHLSAGLSIGAKLIHERCVTLDFEYVQMTPEQVREYNVIIRLLCVFKGLCEGHNLAAQNILREQPKSSVQYNVIETLAHILISQGNNNQRLRSMGDTDLILLIYTMNTLIETTQGPCSENQLILVGTNGFTDSMDKV
jgi:hypothetical protein